MQILEHGEEQGRTLLFFPCTAEPVWAFEATVALLARQWHVFQVVYDGHQPEYPGDFTSVEQTVDEVTAYLQNRGVDRLGAAYGSSLGRDVSDPVFGAGSGNRGAGGHRWGDHTVPLPLFPAAAAPGGGCAVLQDRGQQPQGFGGGLPAGALHPPGP